MRRSITASAADELEVTTTPGESAPNPAAADFICCCFLLSFFFGLFDGMASTVDYQYPLCSVFSVNGDLLSALNGISSSNLDI
jgi:hypothetical protein